MNNCDYSTTLTVFNLPLDRTVEGFGEVDDLYLILDTSMEQTNEG